MRSKAPPRNTVVMPLAHWEEPFDGADVSGDAARFPPFDEVLA